jgi:hypothetical protein
METELAFRGVKSKTTGEDFKTKNLKSEWLTYAKELHEEKLDKLYKTMKAKIKIFKGKPGVTIKLKRWDYTGIFSRATPVELCGSEKDDTKMQARIDNMLEVWKHKMKAPKLDLKLDGSDDTGEGDANPDPDSDDDAMDTDSD